MGMTIGQPAIDRDGLILCFDSTNTSTLSMIPGVGRTWTELINKDIGKFSTPPDVAVDSNLNAPIFNGWKDYLSMRCSKLDLSKDFAILAWINHIPRTFSIFHNKTIFSTSDGQISLSLAPGGQVAFGGIENYVYVPGHKWTLVSAFATRTTNTNLATSIYQNLNFVGSNNTYNLPAPAPYDGQNIFIGAFPSNSNNVYGFFNGADNYMHGNIGMLCVYNKLPSLTKFYNDTKNKFITPSYSSVVTDGLSLHLDAGNTASYSGSGSTWFDLSGNGNHATLINNPTYDSQYGGSIFFNGIDQYATVNHNSNIDFSIPQQGTVFFTYCPQVLIYGSYSILSKGSQYGMGHDINLPGDGRGQIYDTFQFFGPNPITNDTWGQYSFIYNPTSRVVQKSSYAGAVSISNSNYFTSNTSNLNIANFTRGKIAQILIYNRALTQAEVYQNYRAMTQRFGVYI